MNKKHRKIISKYIKCSQCGELGGTTSRVYLEDNRYREQCVRCRYKGYLKLHQLQERQETLF